MDSIYNNLDHALTRAFGSDERCSYGPNGMTPSPGVMRFSANSMGCLDHSAQDSLTKRVVLRDVPHGSIRYHLLFIRYSSRIECIAKGAAVLAKVLSIETGLNEQLAMCVVFDYLRKQRMYENSAWASDLGLTERSIRMHRAKLRKPLADWFMQCQIAAQATLEDSELLGTMAA